MRISIATPKAIKYACLKFHYAKRVPMVQYGFNVFNNKNEWCGVICYGSGANHHIAKPFGLYQGEVMELVRVALNGKQETTSQCLAMTLKELHRIAPHIKMIVSYADCDQNHAGIIYQATNWIYLGKMGEGNRSSFVVKGREMHPKSCHSKGWKQNLAWIRKNVDPRAKLLHTKGKHKYIYCFDKKTRKKCLRKAKPYPKTHK